MDVVATTVMKLRPELASDNIVARSSDVQNISPTAALSEMLQQTVKCTDMFWNISPELYRTRENTQYSFESGS